MKTSVMTTSTERSLSSIKTVSGRPKTSRAVGVGKFVFIFCLTVVAVVLGYTTHYFLTSAERTLAENQFSSITDRAILASLEITLRKRLGTISMASLAATANPDPNDWPFVTMPNYETLSTNLIETSSGREMGFCPLVTLDQVDAFERFAYKFYQEDRYPEPFPNGTGVSDFGEGIWGVNEDGRYHDNTGETPYDSPNVIFAPILHHNLGAFPALMLNLHFQETRGTVIDQIMECSEKRAEIIANKGDEDDESNMECGSITDILQLTSQKEGTGPGALIMQPIYPFYNSSHLAGVIASSIVWEEVLENVFADEVSGIYCILETETQVHTYYVTDGVADLQGEGDLHDGAYNSYRQSISLTGVGLFSDTSPSYTLSLYPSEELFGVYSTKNPRTATVGAVLIILFTSVMFFLYDFFVRQEFSAKKDLLEAKRKFVRFVSHEVRTPLNSVCMGLTLMQEEIGYAIGVKDSTQDSSSEASKPHLPGKKGAASSTIDGIQKQNASEWLCLTEEILVNAQSSVDVLNDLLNYDKIENGSLSLELTVISIWNLIEMTSAEFKLPAAQKKINFILDYGTLAATLSEQEMKKGRPGLACGNLSQEVKDQKVVGDTVRITQVLRNLLSNALKFTKEGGDLNVKARWVKDDQSFKNKGDLTTKFILKNGEEVNYPNHGMLEVAVKDSGAGMSKDQLARLFSQGVQFNVNELQRGQGSGLGLYIAKGIMEQHGGTLVASSEGLGKGTTFTMTLPLFHAPDKSTLPEKSSHAEDKSSDLNSSAYLETLSLRILIVDDSGTNRKLLKRLLTNHGHDCDEAENGSIAVDMVKDAIKEGKNYDTVLLDYEMPVMIGPIACKHMRDLGCDSFIVGITGNVMAEDVAMFKDAGANGVLPKPFKLAELDNLWVEYGVSGGANTRGSNFV